MSDIRARLADALREHMENPKVPHWSAWADPALELADVLLSLSDIAIVELPEPDSDDEWDGQDTGWWVGTRLPEGRIPAAVLRHTLHPNAARRFSAALLAAANKAEEQ